MTNAPFAFTPDGSMLITAHDGLLRYTNVLTGLPTRTVELNGGAGRPVRGCAVSPDGSFLVSATMQGLQLWRLPTGELLRTLEGGESTHDNGADGGEPGTRTGPPALDTSAAALACAVSPDASFVVGTGLDHAVRILGIETIELSLAGSDRGSSTPARRRPVRAGRPALGIQLAAIQWCVLMLAWATAPP